MVSAPDFFTFFVAAVAGIAGTLSLSTSKSGALIGVLVSVTTIPAASNVALTLVYARRAHAVGSLGQFGANVGTLLVFGTLTWAAQRLLVAWRHSRRWNAYDEAMSYTGNVTVGGPPDVREVDGLTISKLTVGSMDNNAYLLRCAATGEGLLIDAANEAERLIDLIGDTHVAQIVTTHQHWDHWQALAPVQSALGATVVAHPQDAGGLPVPVDTMVEDGGTVSFGEVQLSVIHLRGHTPGSIALCYDAGGKLADTPHLFTGDSLFPGGPGKTDNPTDFASLIGDLTQRVFGRLPDGTWVYPGHGKDTTLGAERPHLDEWRERGW